MALDDLLVNTVDIYPGPNGFDADGAQIGSAYLPTPSFTAVPCSVMLGEGMRDVEQMRLGVGASGSIMFSAASIGSYVPHFEDKFLWIDDLGVTHILFATVGTDTAGRGVIFGVPVAERI